MFHTTFKAVPSRNVLRSLPKHYFIDNVRNYADTPNNTSKTVLVKVQGPSTEEWLRVRLARASDVPRVLRFVSDHARVLPGCLSPPRKLLLEDYVSRTLAQGHSILAEYQPKATQSQIRGVALCAALCPWDADLLDRWTSCIKCLRSRDLMQFNAHCMRAAALHEKYQVNNILQTILIVPPESPKSAEIIQILAKHAIKRGKAAGIPLVRFDVTRESVAQKLEEFNMMTKEWCLSYNMNQEAQNTNSQETKKDTNKNEKRDVNHQNSSGSIVVYSVLLNQGARKI